MSDWPGLLEIGTWLAVGGVFAAFGILLKVSDLLQEHGFRWFPASDVVVGSVGTALCAGALVWSHESIHMLWLAIVLHWVLRGRIDGINHGVMATSVLFLLAWKSGIPSGTQLHEFLFFFATLSVLGVLHDFFQYQTGEGPPAIRWFFANQFIYYYLIAAAHSLLFRFDVPLLLSVYGFVKGYAFFYNERRYTLLSRVGIYREGSETPSE